MDKWEDFRNTVYDRLFDGDVRLAFPQMDFTFKAGKWVSSHHLDGTEDSAGKETTYIYSDTRFCAKDQARDESEELIKLYANLNGLDREGAEQRLSELCRVELPSGSGGSDLDKFKAEQESRAAAIKTFQAALFNGSDEAQQALDHLRNGRNWDDELIKATGLGIITKEVQKSLSGCAKDECNYFDHYKKVRLVIPYYIGTKIIGFKFRRLFLWGDEEKDKENAKYIYSKGCSKSNLFGIVDGQKEVVVFESELDTLHAKYLGLNTATATGGGGVSEAQAKNAMRRGVRKFILLFDNDEKGQRFIWESVENIEKAGGKARDVFVATIPTDYKDPDEFLAEHSIDELRTAINKAQRARIYEYKGDVAESEYESFAEWSEQKEQEKARAEELSNTLERLATLSKEGRINEAAALMNEAGSKLRTESEAEEFRRVYAPPSGDMFDSLLSHLNKGLPTSYSFKDVGRRDYPLTLETGITFVCAPTGHGKTSFLNCLALDEAKRNIALNNGKRVLYFTYEIEKGNLLLDLINTYNDNPDISNYPLDTIRGYFNGDRDKWFAKHSGSDYKGFERKVAQFKKDYFTSGALTIIDEEYTAEKLIRSLRNATAENDVSLICIDYAQLIYSEGFARMRTEEIKKIVHDINEFTKQSKLPVVMAAQFNRSVNSPLDVSLSAIGEGGDFERIANTVVGLFNLNSLRPIDSSTDSKVNALLSRLGESCNDGNGIKAIDNKIYAVVLKRRYGLRGVEAIFDWIGKTKTVRGNNPKAMDCEAKEQALFTDDENNELIYK